MEFGGFEFGDQEFPVRILEVSGTPSGEAEVVALVSRVWGRGRRIPISS